MAHEAHDTQSDPIGELLANLFGVARGERPRTVTDWLSAQSQEGLVYQAAIEGAPCVSGCGGADGISVSVASPCVAGTDVPASHRLLFVAFDAHRGARKGVLMSAEQAKELVNRIGEAIAAAERVDASA